MKLMLRKQQIIRPSHSKWSMKSRAVRTYPPHGLGKWARIWQEARQFRVNLAKKKWCDLWHTHLDWDGEGNQSQSIHRRFLQPLLHMFRLAIAELRVQPIPYQVFVMVCPRDAGSDALYVHTPNPNGTTFPHDLSYCRTLDRVPPLLMGLVNLANHEILEFEDTEMKSKNYMVLPRVHEKLMQG